jgi:hypothetical protein
MNGDDNVRAAIQQEWRELGFFYDRDDEAKEWKIIGSCDGLLRFAALLREYVRDPRNEALSEHEHYGPHMYLEVMTWTSAGFDDHSIHGTLLELAHLADLVEDLVKRLGPGQSEKIQESYAPNSPYGLVLEMREADFDPVSADFSA